MMGQFTFRVTPISVIAWTYAFRGVERGRLKGLSASVAYSFPNVFLEIGYMIGGVTDQHIVAVLYSSYLSEQNSFIWSGDLPMTPFGNIYAKAKRLLGTIVVNINGYTELDP